MSIVKDPRKTAIIVASGPSAAPMRTFRVPKKNIAVIVVNGALDWMPYADYFFTLDPSKVNRKRIRTYRHNAKYFVAYPKSKLLLPSYVTRLDRYSPPGDEIRPDGLPNCAIGLSERPNVIHSGNSAWGALGLAYHLGFETVGLIGVDASTEQRVEGGYSRDLTHLPAVFESAMHQIDIVNLGNMQSRIPTMSLDEFAKGVPHRSSKIQARDGIDASFAEQRIRLKAYEAKQAAALTIGAVSQQDKSSLLPDHDASQLADGSGIVLHQDLAVRKEGPGTPLHLPYLTTSL